MNNRDRSSNEIWGLLSAVCDGDADPATFAMLEKALQEDELAGDMLVAFSRLHADLCCVAAGSIASRSRNDRSESLVDDLTTSAIDCDSVSAPRDFRWRRKRSLLGAAALAATVLAACLFRGDERESNPSPGVELIRPPHYIACVTNDEKAVWSRGNERSAGELLAEGETLELVSGTAQISMAYGADIVLQAPCRLTLVGSRYVRLESGAVTAEVAPWAHGFVVETSGLRVTDVGTRFAVTAESSDIAEVHVLEGQVTAEALRSPSNRSERMTLMAGEAMRVDLLQTQFDRVIAQENRFAVRLQDFRPLRPIDIANTGLHLEVGEDDPHWSITQGSDSSVSWPIRAVVGAADSVYRDNHPDASQWISVPAGTTRGVPPDTIHTFETTFDLSEYDVSTVRVIGQFLADNGVSEIRLNGKPVEIVPWEERVGTYNFQTFHVVRIGEAFLPGINRLAIDVINGSWGGKRQHLPTPMGLRVEWQAFGRPVRESLPPGSAFQL